VFFDKINYCNNNIILLGYPIGNFPVLVETFSEKLMKLDAQVFFLYPFLTIMLK